jgi:putative membrane protein
VRSYSAHGGNLSHAIFGLTGGWPQARKVALEFASYWHPLRRLAAREREMDDEARRAAAYVFAQAALSSTSGRTGLLVYVSLFERRVVVLGDERSSCALSDEGIEALRDTAIDHLRQREFATTFVETVRRAGRKLAEMLPAATGGAGADTDELANRLWVFHPRP